MLVSLFGNVLHFRYLYLVVALGVAGVLAWAAYSCSNQWATHVLSDATAINIEQIIKIAKEIEGVQDCHAVRTRVLQVTS